MAEPAYTHGHHESVLRSHRWRTAENSAGYLLAAPAAGPGLLDVGCGPGTITVDLAGRGGAGPGRGLDSATAAIDAARAPRRGRGERPVRGRRRVRADSRRRSFDVVHAHQVLQHLTDPVAALREMRACAGRAGSSPSATATTPP